MTGGVMDSAVSGHSSGVLAAGLLPAAWRLSYRLPGRTGAVRASR